MKDLLFKKHIAERGLHGGRLSCTTMRDSSSSHYNVPLHCRIKLAEPPNASMHKRQSNPSLGGQAAPSKKDAKQRSRCKTRVAFSCTL
eukprot:scaffold34678_cov248-Amphora_coffeaeformis.AAC.3